MITTVGSVTGFSFLSTPVSSETTSTASVSAALLSFGCFRLSSKLVLKVPQCANLYAVSAGTKIEEVEEDEGVRGDSASTTAISQSRRSADWKAARAYQESRVIYEGRVEGFNGGGLLVRFYSLVGFVPYPQLIPSHSCKEPKKSIQEVAEGLVGSVISLKVIEANEAARKLIFSEKEAIWSKVSGQVNIGDIFEAKVGYVEDYGAFVHLRFADGCYYLTGLVHVSEVSWDLVHDVRDILNVGDDVKVKVINIDWEKRRVTLSIKQLESDPLLETLDKVIPQVKANPQITSDSSNDLLPGLESICQELLKEDGIIDVRIGRRGFEKRVVSQDLQLWLSNVPVEDKQFTLLARAGREVQEVHLTTYLDQEGIKLAVQRVLERIP